jgi:hypothetical protein
MQATRKAMRNMDKKQKQAAQSEFEAAIAALTAVDVKVAVEQKTEKTTGKPMTDRELWFAVEKLNAQNGH